MNISETSKGKIIIVAHRGTFGGNIPCNTIASYEIALLQGADMIETDVNITSDGKLIIFHPGMEKPHLCLDKKLPEMTWDEVSKLRFVNIDNVPTQFGIESFDDLLEHFKNRCFINVDKFWDNPEAIYRTIKRHNMEDQILVKSKLKENVLTVLKEVAPDIAFMPIVETTHPRHEELMKSGINYVGTEVLFYSDDDEVVSPKFIDRMHKDGKLLWANSIIYDCTKQIAAGHSDDTALTKSMDESWGWLADRGFDFIQTDWPIMLINYLKGTNKYYKKG